MRYDKERGAVSVSVPELVRLARIRYRTRPLPEEEPDGSEPRREGTPLTDVYESGGRRWVVSGDASFDGEGDLVLSARVPGNPGEPDPELVRQTRGEGFCLLAVAERASRTGSGGFKVIYRSPSGETREVRERPKREDVARFYARLFEAVERDAAAEIERAEKRLPSMANAVFPFASVREGQRELISSAYRAIRGGYTLYACAPTGIGKTMSVLFPAVRAMGEGYCDKIFYLTPKNTAALAAAEAAKRLAAAGADLRVLILSAKDRICPHGTTCREIGEQKCPLSRSAPAREDEAARELMASGETVIDLNRLREAGEKAKVCPYELALRYAEFADVVICDYNYLFHPRVALRRFFSERGEWCFLCDEAHNLVDRARELYSCDLPLTFFDAFIPVSEKNPTLKKALDRTVTTIRSILAPLVADAVETDGEGIRRGFYRQNALPEGLAEAAAELLDVAFTVLEERKLPPDLSAGLRDAAYDLSEIVWKLGNYSSRFTSFITLRGDALTYRALCLDPSELIASRLSLGRSAVLFSATMTPTSYYRTVLGGKPTDDELDLPSPFDPTQLSVAVLDRIGTRFSEREDTLGAVARAVLTAVKAKPGNYLVFCPSFSYLDRLAGEVSRLAPGLDTAVQGRRMDRRERQAFLDRFSEDNRRALVGFTVMGGVFAEGIDLVGRRLIGAIVVGVGLSQPTPENEAIRGYYDDTLEAGREYAYIYPGMNRVLQAAGRVIRREEDRGVVVLIDDRFSEPLYRNLMPNHWRGLKYVGDLKSLSHLLGRFWNGGAHGPGTNE